MTPEQQQQRYRIEICTSNLGATHKAKGDPVLRHCFLRITDDLGQPFKTLAFGPHGVGPEPYPDVASVQCHPHATDLGREDLDRTVKLFINCTGRGYSWSENNCCSCAIEAVEQAFGGRAHPSIHRAAEMIAQSPNPFERPF
jgi:hypothetical protein